MDSAGNTSGGQRPNQCVSGAGGGTGIFRSVQPECFWAGDGQLQSPDVRALPVSDHERVGSWYCSILAFHPDGTRNTEFDTRSNLCPNPGTAGGKP